MFKKLIFYVTNRCNARCGHCFYWKSLNVEEVLSLDNIQKIFSSIGELDTLLIAGGEPFLRKDLIEVCKYIIKNNKVKLLSIPTNGTFKEHVIKLITELHDKVKIRIYVSLDGLKETHNRVRDLDCFDQAIDLLKTLVEMKDEYNFSPLSMITVTNQNYAEVDQLAKYLNDINVHYSITPVRGSPKDPELRPPTSKEWKELVQRLTKERRFLGEESSFHNNNFGILKKIHRKILTHSKTKMYCDALDGKRNYVCKAGDEIGVLDYDGKVSFCELTPPVGNVKDYDYDFGKVWASARAEEMRPKVQTCVCTHGCFISTKYMRAAERLSRLTA